MKNPAIAEDLLGRMRDADVTALAAFYDRHATRVYSLALRILRQHADAEEVVQEAFLQVWREAARFDPERGTIESWLLLITRSRAIDRVRTRKRRAQREAPSEHLEHQFAAADRAVDLTLIEAQASRAMRRVLEAIPAPQRVPLELAFFQRLTHPEIAEILQQPLGTVKTRIRAGLQRMRNGLADVPVDAPTREPSPFTVALSEYLAKRPVLTPAYRSLEGLRVLVVDDDLETVGLLRTVLESAGAHVSTGRSASEGLAHLHAAWPDVMVADICMPGEDGYSLLRQARALAEVSGRRLSALAFTAFGRRETDTAPGAGFEAHLAKPVQPHTLLDAVARLAGRSGAMVPTA
ncbi:MAG: sigma-70 family RNA polymerase sigma factor [Acidobacteria bacterium]|nr:sigma-70 family RNA polymerase sigma factor [Acidobacteriota bacterium]